MNKIEITEKMALNGAVCPVCSKFFMPNGVGPMSSPTLTKWLSKLPSDHVLRYGAMFHDWAYHCGPNWGLRIEADQLMYDKNEIQIKKCAWYKRGWLRLMNKRNYFMVRKFGESSYEAEGCGNRQ